MKVLLVSALFSITKSEGGFQKYITLFTEHHYTSTFTVILESNDQKETLKIPEDQVDLDHVQIFSGENEDEIEEVSKKKPLLCESRPLDLVFLLDSRLETF